MMNTQNISILDIVSQTAGNIVSDMDGEKVMLSIENGKYFNLGELGGEIWELIQSPISIEKLVRTLMEQYEVEERICKDQVMTFLSSLYDEGLIQVAKS